MTIDHHFFFLRKTRFLLRRRNLSSSATPEQTYHRGSSVAGPSSDPSLRHACSRASYFAGDRERGWISFRSAGCFRNFRIRADACCFFFFFPFSSSLPLPPPPPGRIRNACFNYCAVYAPGKIRSPASTLDNPRSVRPFF